MRNFRLKVIQLLSLVGFCWLLCTSFFFYENTSGSPSFETVPTPWADSVLCELSVEEKIGQLFMVAAYSNRGYEHKEHLTELIEKHHIGGLIFFQGTPHRQLELTRYFQETSELPLLIGMDAEWGARMRLDSMPRYPRAMMLGAADVEHTYQTALAAGRELRALGAHVSFSPVLDVNNNPDNPVINSRSFGELPGRVGRYGESYYKGLRDAGLIAVAKHFPGHGDTDVDSHLDLPVLQRTKAELDAVELLPFKRAIAAGIPGVMVAHMNVPALDSSALLPASLSKPIVTGVLREELGFEGLIFTDALNMKGVTKYYKPGDADLQALLAGNDILLFPEDVKAAISAVKSALRKGRLTEEELDAHVGKILRAKEQQGLHKRRVPDAVPLPYEMQNPENDLANRRAHAAALTLLLNRDSLLPLKDLQNKHLLSIALGNEKEIYPFQESLQLFGRVETEYLPKKPTSFERELIYRKLTDKSVVLVSLHSSKLSPQGNFGITAESLRFVEELAEKYPVILVSFANPYALKKLRTQNLAGLVVAYEEGEYAQHYAAEGIFGSIGFAGKLPVTINDAFLVKSGLQTKAIPVFHHTIPEAVGLHSGDFKAVDSIAEFGMQQQAYPGCQILVAKAGNVLHHKAFGYHTYESKQPVSRKDLYDLASITKVASTVASCMYLDDLGLFSPEKTLGDYLPELTKGTEYSDILIKDMLTHRAGLRSWIPFYQSTMSKGVPRYDVYSLGKSEMYPHRVAENFFIHKNYPDSVIKQILDTPLHKEKEYRYSDLGYYFLQIIIEKQTGVPLEHFVDSVFYKPMGLATTGYLPAERFGLEEIVPTEYDMAFRKQLVHGDVHDPGAAMNGGVGGHAGLFSNANDLAKVMQMFLTGVYGDHRFLSDSVLSAYTDCLYCKDPEIDNRRGLGFDKPVTDGDGGPTCSCISLASFGHTGFTGTIAWADPEQEIVYVFLSNRVYPDAQNKKLITLGIRTEIMQAIYDANHNAKQIGAVQ